MLIVDGLRLPGHFQPALVERARGYHQPDGDILVVSYPKAGTHWLCHILAVVLADFGTPATPVYLEAAGDNGSATKSTKDRIVFSHVPVGFFERPARLPCEPSDIDGVGAGDVRPRPTVQETLRRFRKVIYLCRNPADVIVSYHYHCRTLSKLYGDGYSCQSLDEFAQLFLSDECCYGSYFSHVRDWLSCKGCDLHVVAYEELQLDFDATVSRLIRFIGKDQWLASGGAGVDKLRKLREECTVKRTRTLIERQVTEMIGKHVDGDHLSQDQRQSVSCIQREASDRERFVSVFAHKGLIGEGRANLSEDILAKLNRLTIAHLSDTPIVTIWKKLGVLV
ncbi:sulfotransferase family cytosolic 2B member 1-like [Tropilaelaps mercedesae]|uniref:Sulfotransferase family cytosolic 2B member 1-like n=1 Tax=Tropilaelaps mercedesae TaxID=418985 RepID=A0A1V9XKT8_9ACAR|nr:sulfotransferase family cytosolic 2B member 1-like [Tropilaelaps mercedesae]